MGFLRICRLLSLLRGNGGFSTLDVTAAVGIAAALAAITVPGLMAAMDTANINATVEEIRGLRASLLRFYADTRRLPVVDEGDDRDIEGDEDDPRPKKGKRTSGLRRNPEKLRGWSGPYIQRELRKNRYGGGYKLSYTQSFKTRGKGKGNGKEFKSPALHLSNIKAEAQRIIDERLDDGKADTGIIQVKGATSSTDFDEDKDLVVIIFEGVDIDEATGK